MTLAAIDRQFGTDNEFSQGVDRSVNVLREMVNQLIEQRGGVGLSVDGFSKRIDINSFPEGMGDINEVMRRLKSALQRVFLDEYLSFKVVSAKSGVISIEKSDRHSRVPSFQMFSRRLENKGRLNVGRLDFLNGATTVNVYGKEDSNGKIFVLISRSADLDLHDDGFQQHTVEIDAHGRITLTGILLPEIFRAAQDVKIYSRGDYACIAPDSGGSSRFASFESYKQSVFPLIENR